MSTNKLSLKNYNTFGLDVQAQRIVELTDIEQLKSIEGLTSHFILGGGSNVLFTQDLDYPVLLNRLKGIRTSVIDNETTLLEVAAGEQWHDAVTYAVSHDLGGIENLSLIPGCVGAAPMQNIGAYGVEIKDVLSYVDAIALETLEPRRFSNEECEFGYRESIFKSKIKGQYLITGIGMELSSKNHKLNTHYGAIQEVLKQKHITQPTLKDISAAVIDIRQSKLPDPSQLGNAGSFFKNPVIPASQFSALHKEFPTIKSYPVSELEVKVPAGWLIESLGWKGKRVGNTGSHASQALVLVNYGNASGQEIKQLSEAIKASIWDTYKIKLETEVNIY